MGVSVEVRELKNALIDLLNLSKDIKYQRERYEEMAADIGTVGAPELSDMPKGPPNPSDKIGALLVRFEKLSNEIKALEQQQMDIEDQLENVLKRLKNPDERYVIRLRYIYGKSWREVASTFYKAQDIKISVNNQKELENNIQHYHGKALVHMIEVCNENPSLKFWGKPSD